MSRKSTFLIALSAGAMAVLITIAQIPVSQEATFCSGLQTVNYDHELPMSHPINRCASPQSSGVSWYSWLSGRSSYHHLYFIDLLELLSRPLDRSKDPVSGQS